MFALNVALLFASASLVFAQESFNCESKESCRDCIQEINCVWCITPITYGDDKAPVHCTHQNTSTGNWCQDSVISLKMSNETLEDDPLTSDKTKPIQLKPQRVKVSLRKGEKIDVKFQYQQAKDYPVDLYYIMDLSNSMDPHREKLAELGIKLAEAMRNLTSNFKLGFGSFIDKVDLPFVSTVPQRLQDPCGNVGINRKKCATPYSFKNHLGLTENYNQFNEKVTASQVSGNLDAPEGGFDAIMQAIVCKQEIGWRSQARHLLVFSTDALFHIAGDGKLAGVLEPNDAKCHMKNDVYTDYLIYDYPSVSQINYVAKENNINIIFAIVANEFIRVPYQKLSERIENSNYGELEKKTNQQGDADHTNIINLILKNYRRIVQSVTLTSNATNEVDVKFSSTCKSSKPNGCNNVHVGEIIDFTATIQLRECPTNGEKTKIISIKPEALDETLTIELELLCECPCSSKSDPNYKENSAECSDKGDLECGVCKCFPGRFGRNCQCDGSTNLSNNTINCQVNEQSEMCSGLGECKCGKCECRERPDPKEKIYGKFCQCTNYSCKWHDGLLCSGKGTCDCGKCSCSKGYTGDACQCPDSNSTCIAPGSDLVCSGHGSCDCGQCECLLDGSRHSGKYCEECVTCPAQRCEELRDCVECQAYNTGDNKMECDTKCTDFKTIVVDKFEEDNEEIKKCRVADKAGCIMIFEYTYLENNLIVRALKEKLCATAPNILAWILGVIGTILIVGLITLIAWKILTTIHDRREYAKFENERKGLRWNTNENPLFKNPTSTFANPGFKEKSKRNSLKKK